MVKAADLRDMADQELLTRLAETKQEMFNLRFQLATGQLDNHARMSEVRRDVARLRTVIRQREIAAAEALAEGPTNASDTTEETA
jgi:large subunit ribosomal protein L29